MKKVLTALFLGALVIGTVGCGSGSTTTKSTTQSVTAGTK